MSENAQSQQQQSISSAASSRLASYNPTPADTVLVRSFLVKFGLPVELALQIVDYANYFPQVRGNRTESLSFTSFEGVSNSVAALYVVTDPIPLVENGERIKIQSVRFRMRSHDQGWGGDPGCQGTYEGSWSWFEASIIRPNEDDPPSDSAELQRHGRNGKTTILDSMRPTMHSLQHFKYHLVPTSPVAGAHDNSENVIWHIQSNVCAEQKEKEHEVCWIKDEESEPDPGTGKGEGFLETLRPGDRIGVWVRAQFPGWQNYVEEIDVEVGVKIE